MSRCSLSILGAFLLLGSLWGQDAAVDIAQAVRDLGASSYQVRKQAREALADLGYQAKAELEKAARSTDPEVAETARKLLAALLPGVTSNTPDNQRELVKQYVNTKAPGAAEALLGKLAKERPFPCELFQNLLDWEPDAARRSLLARSAWKELPALREQLALAPDAELYGRVLSWAARAETEDAIPLIAAHALHRGLLDDTRRHVAARAGTEPTAFSRRLLAELHLLAGDADKAVAEARKLADWPYLEEILVCTGHWNELAKELAERWENPSELQRVQLAAAQRLAGQEELGLATLGKVMAYDEQGKGVCLAKAAGASAAVDGTLDLLAKQGLDRRFVPATEPTHGRLFVHGAKTSGSQRREKESAARCLLAHGFTADAIQIMVSEGDLADAAELLHHRRQYEQADKLMADAIQAAKPPETWFLTAKRAGMLWKAGDAVGRQQVQDLLAAYRAGELAGMDDKAFRQLLWAIQGAGLGELAAAAAPEIMERFAGKPEIANCMVASLRPGTSDVNYWWDRLQEANPSQAPSARAKQLRAFLDGCLPPEETQDILGLALRVDKPDPRRRMRGLLAVARAAAMLGRQSEAEASLELVLRYATQARDQDLRQQYGATALHVFGRALDWQALADAASVQATARDLSPLACRANYLAWGGDREAGRDVAERLLALTHAGNVRKVEEALLDGGWDMSSRLLPLAMASRRDPEDPSLRAARAANDYAAQLLLQQRRWYHALSFPENEYYFTHGLLRLNTELAYSECQAMIATGKVADGLARAQQAVSMDPEREWRLIDVAAQLEKAAAKAEAGALADHALAMEQRIQERFPDARDTLFGFAWISGCTKRQMDRGEYCARRLVAIAPDEPVLREALAVVLHAKGDTKRAIEILEGCMRAQPSLRYLARLGAWREMQKK